MSTLKRLHRALLTLDDGTALEVTRIGRGRYAEAWANGSTVYLAVADGPDCSKEIMSVECGAHPEAHGCPNSAWQWLRTRQRHPPWLPLVQTQETQRFAFFGWKDLAELYPLAVP